ncbi:MAG: hypothetical protein ACYS99_16845, partial [Planctomycetota bacterium]
MRRAAIAVLLIGLAATVQAGEDGEAVVDVGAILEEIHSSFSPRLGTSALRPGGHWDTLENEDDVWPGLFALDDFVDLLQAGGPDRDGTVTGFGRSALILASAPAAELRSDLDGFVRDLVRDVRVEVEVTHRDGRVSRGEIRTRPGWWGRMTRVRAHRIVWDMDVELACDNSGGFRPCVVGDPVVATALDGLAVQARPFLVDGGRRVALEALVQLGDVRRVDVLQTGARYLGSIELPTYRGAVVAVSGTVASSEPLVARLRSSKGETVVRLTPHVSGRPSAGGLRALDAGLALIGAYDVAVKDDREWSTPGAWGRASALYVPFFREDEVRWDDLVQGIVLGGGFIKTGGGGRVAAA